MEMTDKIVLFFGVISGGVLYLLWNIAGNISGCVDVLCEIRAELKKQGDDGP